MAKRISPKPTSFADHREQDYWHEAQDIAFRAGASLVVRDKASWLISDDGDRLICEPQQPERIWYETWRILNQEYPLLSRLWVGGRALTKPGEILHNQIDLP
jgi:hypothetical protein